MWVTHIAAPVEDGTDTVFRNVGLYYSDAGKIPRREFIKSGFDSRHVYDVLPFCKAPRPAVRPTDPPTQWHQVLYPGGLKRPLCSSANSPPLPSSDEVMNACSYDTLQPRNMNPSGARGYPHLKLKLEATVNVWVRPTFFWVVMRRRFVVGYRRFGTSSPRGATDSTLSELGTRARFSLALFTNDPNIYNLIAQTLHSICPLLTEDENITRVMFIRQYERR